MLRDVLQMETAHDIGLDVSPMGSSSKLEGLRRASPKSLGPGPKVTYTHTARKFILHLQSLKPEKLKKILIIPPKPHPGEPRPRRTGNATGHRAQPEAASALVVSATPFPPFPSAAHEDEKPKPYGGILTDSEAATTETLPTQASRACFEKARMVADRERDGRLKLSASMNAVTGAGQKGKDGEKKIGGATKIDCIHFGEHEIDTWYAAPYPEEYSKNRVLWICEFCLKYMNSEYVSWRHKVSELLALVVASPCLLPSPNPPSPPGFAFDTNESGDPSVVIIPHFS